MEEAHQGSRRSRFLNKFRKSGKISPNTDASVQTVVAGEGTIDGITIITQDSGNEAPLVEKRATTSRLPLDCKDERVEAYDDAKQDENSYFRPKTLWERACDEVENSEEFKAFIIQYQKILLSQDPQDDVLSLASRKNGMGKLIEQQKKTLEEGRWGFILLGRSFKVAEVVSKIIKGIIKIEGTLQTILRGSGEPHAAMIVAGVSILLPVS